MGRGAGTCGGKGPAADPGSIPPPIRERVAAGSSDPCLPRRSRRSFHWTRRQKRKLGEEETGSG